MTTQTIEKQGPTREQKDIIADALNKLNRAHLMLEHWLNSYSFYDTPTPAAAQAGDEQSMKWFFDYPLIQAYIDIAFDSIIDAQRELKKIEV